MMFDYFRAGVRPDHFNGASWLFIGLRIVWAVLVILFIIWVVKSLINANKVTSAKEVKLVEAQINSDALKIVRERYAKGEITKEQYDLYLLDLK